MMQEIIEYALKKLLKEADNCAECFIRAFYKTNSVNSAELVQVLEMESSKYSAAYSILPVSGLVLQNTVLSVCGVRHQ